MLLYDTYLPPTSYVMLLAAEAPTWLSGLVFVIAAINIAKLSTMVWSQVAPDTAHFLLPIYPTQVDKAQRP